MNWREQHQRFIAWQQQPFSHENRSEGTVCCANCGTEYADYFCAIEKKQDKHNSSDNQLKFSLGNNSFVFKRTCYIIRKLHI